MTSAIAGAIKWKMHGKGVVKAGYGIALIISNEEWILLELLNQ